jgi:branched-chain amino acid transport system permease protein
MRPSSAVGAYAQAVLTVHGLAVPADALVAATFLSAAAGVVVGTPALRLKGIYLGIATLAFGFIIEEVFARWEGVTGGNAGMHVKAPTSSAGSSTQTPSPSTTCASCCAWQARWRAQPAALAHRAGVRRHPRLRDLGAEHGHQPGAYYKTLSFAISAALAGHGGRAVRAQDGFMSPEQFGLMQSVDLLLLIVVGGLGFVHGAFLGAIFLITMPQLIALGKDYLPRRSARRRACRRWSTASCWSPSCCSSRWACTAAG